MSKIYIVTMGDYFETAIYAVFDSPELAAQYVRTYGDSVPGGLAIEEHELNRFAGQLRDGILPFAVRMDAAGRPLEIQALDLPFDEEQAFDRELMLLRVFARDEEQARQTAEHKWNQLFRGPQPQPAGSPIHNNPLPEEL